LVGRGVVGTPWESFAYIILGSLNGIHNLYSVWRTTKPWRSWHYQGSNLYITIACYGSISYLVSAKMYMYLKRQFISSQ